MAQCVVEQLEIVEVNEHQRAKCAVARTRGHGLSDAIEQERAVGQARELVKEGQFLDPLLGVLALRNVMVRGDVMRDGSVRILHHRDAE